MSVGTRLGQVAASITLDETTTHAALRCVVDWAGCALGGTAHPATSSVEGAIGAIGEGESATVVGRETRRSAFAAALLNGVASHVLDYDDVNVVMIGHPAAVVIPAALAAAESAGRSGRELLAGIVAGYEVAARLGQLVNPEHYERGWHATGTLGTLAAAAACARVAGFCSADTARVLTVAATSAGGVRAVFGSHGKAFNAGHAAASGLLAQVLIGAGFDVPEEALEGPGGWLEASGGMAPLASLDDVPRRPAVLDTAFKGHAACGATHCLIDAVAGLVLDNRLDPHEIERIDASVHRLAVRAAGDPAPETALQAKFSLRHTAAMAAFEYPLLQGSFTDQAVQRTDVVALRERTVISIDEDLRYDQAMPARVTLTCCDGRIVERFVDTPRGRPGDPMTDEELGRKFRSMAAPVLGSDRAGVALRALWGLAEASDLRSTMTRLQP